MGNIEFSKNTDSPGGKGNAPDFNVIVADTDWQTFEALGALQKEFNLLNLSSEFAVSFILDYEKIDVLLLSKRIADIESIRRKAEKKMAKVFVMGLDLKYPVDACEVKDILQSEYSAKVIKSSSNANAKKAVKSFFKKVFTENNRLLKAENRAGYTGKDANEKSGENSCEDAYEDLFKELEMEKSSGPKEEVEIAQEPVRETVRSGLTEEDFWGEKLPGSQRLKSEVYNMDPVETVNNSNYIAIKQKILVFIKAKGGVGSTILSVLLAYQLRKLKTLLIDMNFSEGGSDLGYYLEMPRTPNMTVFTEGYNRDAMDNSIISFKGYFDIVQAPPSYELTKKLDLQDIYSLVDVARKKYHLIIFDMPNNINDIFLGVLDMADLVILVSDFTTGSIGRLASITNRFIYSDVEKILVMNRTRNGNAAAFARNGFRDFLGLKEVLSINECEALADRTSFTGLDLSKLKEVNAFAAKVLEKLAYE